MELPVHREILRSRPFNPPRSGLDPLRVHKRSIRSLVVPLIRMRPEVIPLRLREVLRDYFGAHTYQRNDKGPDAPFVHTEWIQS